MWAFFGTLADIAVLSLLWTLCSLPVITAGAATAALMRSVINMHTGLGNWRAKHFFKCFRSNFRSATLLWLPFLLAAAVFLLNILILKGVPGSYAGVLRIASVIGLIIWLFTAIWTFTLTSLFENSFIQTIRNALILAFSWLPRTILMGILCALPVALTAFAPYIMSRIVVLWPVLFFGAAAYLCARLMVRPLTPYLGDLLSENEDDESGEYPDADLL